MGGPAIPVIDLFEGQTLTVTVTFGGTGARPTRPYELHAGWLWTAMVDGTPRLTTRRSRRRKAPSAAKIALRHPW